MALSAMRFCGEEMGELWPPMLAASAMPICGAKLIVEWMCG